MLTEIMATTDRKAALCGLGDDELDRCCAEVQGWELHREDFGRASHPDVQRIGVKWFWRFKNSGGMSQEAYTPSRDLNQAWELANYAMDRLPICISLGAGINPHKGWYGHAEVEGTAYGGRKFTDTIKDMCGFYHCLTFDEARSHSRAACILSCLALTEGME